MSVFARHGIKHLSASSINLWSTMPGLWVLRYLCDFRDTAGPAATRGNAVEAGLLHLLHKRPDPLAVALDTFDRQLQGELSEEIDDERQRIPGMLAQCKAWKPPGELRASQLKVECWLDGIDVPVIGYVDFCFDDTDIDLKTTKACPSKPKADHVRQVSLYRRARDTGGRLLYVTDKKFAEFEVTDEMRDSAIAELTLTAASLANYLDRADSPQAALRCLPIDRDNFRWSSFAERHYRDVLDGKSARLSPADVGMLADVGISLGFEAEDI